MSAGRRSAALRNEPVFRGVDRDLVDPRIELAVAAERADRPVRADERLLGDVLAFAPVGYVTRNHADELVLVFPDQEIEGAFVALLDAQHQRLIDVVFAHPGRSPLLTRSGIA